MTPDPSPFKADCSEASLNFNEKVLANFGYDVEKVIDAQGDSVIAHGKEFRPTHVLGPLLHDHPYWKAFEQLSTSGAKCEFKELSENQRKEDLEQAIERGNHKSAASRPDLLQSLVDDDIVHGYQAPMPIRSSRLIVNGVLVPCGISDQDSINELGEIISKNRLTHDQSFDFSEKNSVNNRLIRDNLPELRYGSCLQHILHYIHALRFSNPHVPIVIGKIDFKSACRRQSMCGWLAAMTLTIVGSFALLSFRLPFGGAYCPFHWCLVSEFICDFANALLRCEHWDASSLDFACKEKNTSP